MKQPEFENNPRHTIRPATPADAEQLLAMWGQSFVDTYPNDEYGISRERMESEVKIWQTPDGIAQWQKYFANLPDNPTRMFEVAEQGGQIAGYVCGILQDNKEGFLWGLYTDKSTHGTGLSQDMMEKVMEFFRQNQMQKVTLHVVSYNDRAINFFQKFGFDIVPGTNETLGMSDGLGGIPEIMMERSII